MCTSPKYGGLGLEAVTAGVAAEELGKADEGCAMATLFLVQNAWSYILDKYGTEKAKDEVLPRVRKGKAFLGIATTEPGVGSDLASMKTRIVKSGNGYVLNGEKSYISGVREADKSGGGFVTLARMVPELGTRGMTLFFLPIKGVPGITTHYLEELGREGISWGGFFMDNVAIPEYYLIGEENRGFYIVHEGFEFARGLIALVCVGVASRALQNAIDYMKERQAFGQSIARYEGLQFALAEDYARLEAVRLLSYKALWIYEGEQKEKKFSRFEVSKAIAMAKMLAPVWAFEIINHAMQWQGAYGYSMDCPEQRGLRGVRSYTLAEGSTEIMKLIVAREVLGREFLAYR
jgi:acyl-CoA dehydrogenase